MKPFAHLLHGAAITIATASCLAQTPPLPPPPPSPGNVIYACVNNATGIPRIVTNPTFCVANEHEDQWNIQGVQGAQGPAGLPGPAGIQGAAGLPGPAGPAGIRGTAGPAGPAGIEGATGAPGPAGIQGVPGPVGPAGIRGLTGAAGPAGVQGPTGPTGPAGVAGPQGPAGGTIPADLTTLSNLLGTSGYNNADFRYPISCTLGDVILSANAYGGGGAAKPADGTLLQISQNTAVFSLLGTRFGGDGIRTFAVPDLRGYAPNGLQYSICVQGIYPARN